MKLPALSILVTVSLASIMWTSSAFACVHGMKNDRDTEPDHVTMMESSYHAGSYRRAIRMAMKEFPVIKGYDHDYEAKLDEVVDLGWSVDTVAISVVRLKGRVDLSRASAPKSDNKKVRKKSLAWAIAALEKSLARDPDNVTTQAFIAEAQLQTAATRKRGIAKLESLAQDDLLVDAGSWLELARLRKDAGNKELAGDAVKRCMDTAWNDSICTLGGGKRAKAKKSVPKAKAAPESKAMKKPAPEHKKVAAVNVER